MMGAASSVDRGARRRDRAVAAADHAATAAAGSLGAVLPLLLGAQRVQSRLVGLPGALVGGPERPAECRQAPSLGLVRPGVGYELACVLGTAVPRYAGVTYRLLTLSRRHGPKALEFGPKLSGLRRRNGALTGQDRLVLSALLGCLGVDLGLPLGALVGFSLCSCRPIVGSASAPPQSAGEPAEAYEQENGDGAAAAPGSGSPASAPALGGAHDAKKVVGVGVQ